MFSQKQIVADKRTASNVLQTRGLPLVLHVKRNGFHTLVSCVSTPCVSTPCVSTLYTRLCLLTCLVLVCPQHSCVSLQHLCVVSLYDSSVYLSDSCVHLEDLCVTLTFVRVCSYVSFRFLCVSLKFLCVFFLSVFLSVLWGW